jgi:hypothetical protein
MNGRVFDYNVGRFTGVDPFIQFPLNSQSLNPYSYTLNNPLSGTDPTGYRSVCVGGSCRGTIQVAPATPAPQVTRPTGRDDTGGRNLTVGCSAHCRFAIGANGSDGGSGNKPEWNEQSNDIGGKIKDKISDIKSTIRSVGNALLESIAPEAARFRNMSDEDREAQKPSGFWMAVGFSNAGASALNDSQSLLVDMLSRGQISYGGGFRPLEVPDEHVESAARGEGLVNLLTMPVVEIRGAQGETTAWRMGKFDFDFRGTSAGLKDALNIAFERVGLPKIEFEVTKWGKNEYGKSFPVEWRHRSGAEVNIDRGHLKNGPSVPHVGY